MPDAAGAEADSDDSEEAEEADGFVTHSTLRACARESRTRRKATSATHSHFSADGSRSAFDTRVSHVEMHFTIRIFDQVQTTQARECRELRAWLRRERGDEWPSACYSAAFASAAPEPAAGASSASASLSFPSSDLRSIILTGNPPCLVPGTGTVASPLMSKYFF